MSGDPAWGGVSLLLRGDGVNGSTTIVDSSPLPKAVTAVGNARISTGQSKFYGSSLYFDGSGDYLSIPSSTAFGFGTGDFTIEAFIYIAGGQGTDRNIADFRSAADPVSATFFIDGPTNKLALWYGAKLGATGSALTTSTWYHVALTRGAGVLRCFLNGGLDWSSAALVDFGSSKPLGVGACVAPQLLGAGPFNGHMNDLCITKWVSRYSSSFTPPAAACPSAPDDWIMGGRGIMQSIRPVSAPQLYSGARPIRPSFTRADGSPGRGSVIGTVKVDTLPVSRKVRLFDVATGRLLKEVWSDKSGVYRFDGLALDRPFTVLSHDHLRDYNATVADYVYAEVLP